MGLTESLARFVCAPVLAGLPIEAFDKSARILTDTLGVMAAGAASDIAPALRRYTGLSGDPEGLAGRHAPVVGQSRTMGRERAALVNATFGAAIDFDDVLSMMPAHPSAIILASVLAYCADRRISGEQLIEAHIVALETGARLGAAIGLGHYNQGFHGTGTLGVFCGVAAIAKALPLDVNTTRTAFGIAASMASGINRNFGTMTKSLHSGWAARHAVAAIALARAGMSAAPDAFEGPAGFFDAFGTDASNPRCGADAWGKPWVIVAPGVSLRKFACYNANQRPMQGLLDLLAKTGATAATIRRIECRMPPGGMQGSIYPAPATGLEAKFSLHYVLAAGAVDGRYSLWTFADEAVAREEITAMLRRVSAYESALCAGDDPDFASKTPGTRGFVEVELELTDGACETIRVHVSPGHPRIGLSWTEIEEKFKDCARFGGVNDACAQTAFESMRHLQTQPDIHRIVCGLSA